MDACHGVDTAGLRCDADIDTKRALVQVARSLSLVNIPEMYS
jgi:hypothetical protein